MVFDGYNQGDYLLHVKHHIQFDALNLWQLNGQLILNNRTAFLKQSDQFSNHYKWQNQLQKTNVQGLVVDFIKNRKQKGSYGAYVYSLPKTAVNVQGAFYNIDGFIYYNALGQVEQLSKKFLNT